MEKVFFKISQNLQESICDVVSFSIKLHFHQIKVPVQVHYCEFCVILKSSSFINVYERLILKSKISESLFVKLRVFTIIRIDNCCTMKELGDIFY